MKKLFSFMLTLVMLVACLSSTAFAEEMESVESYATPNLCLLLILLWMTRNPFL